MIAYCHSATIVSILDIEERGATEVSYEQFRKVFGPKIRNIIGASQGDNLTEIFRLE